MPDLSSDCSSCSGLCCVLLPYTRADGFGTTKQGGTPCHHLASDDSCRIHATLRRDGWEGCTRFECFGAGQHVTQVTYGGASWRDHGDLGEMGAVFTVVRAVHEMLLHLRTAAKRAPDPVQDELSAELLVLDGSDPATLLAADLDDLHQRVGQALHDASARVRSAREGADLARRDLAGKDLAGKDLAGRDLRGATLRGALLLRADLRGADLTDADVLGADLRDADVRGARLAGSLFLTQPQANAAIGDTATTLPPELNRPGHWAVPAAAADGAG
jgi:hypothetical protein